jgi:PEP-CTERM motif-containing protein
MSTLNQQIRKIAAGAVLTLGAIAFSSAHAAGIFTVNPTSIPGGTGSIFQADFVSGSSTTRVTNTGGTDYSAVGFITYTGFSLNSTPIGAGTTGLTVSYGLYATFDQTFTCPALLSPGTTCTVDTITLNVFADPGFQDTFTQATLASNPTVTDVGGNDILLGTANVVFSGTAGINDLGGAFENVNTNFLLTAAGSSYFINPVPFFNLAFSEFNNTSAGIVCTPTSCVGATTVAITGESGGTQFLRIPEPASLGLLGIALAAAGFVRRRKG